VPAPSAEKKGADEALDVESFGFDVYTVEPGERVAWGITLTHETRSEPTSSRAR
jgi:hypothetical protein